MESLYTNTETGTNSTLDATVELPVLQRASKTKVDIYLPRPVKGWKGPALQEALPVQTKQDALELHIPPNGMLRPDNPKLFVDRRLPARSNQSPAPEIKSYARRSAKRGLLYTVIFVLLLCGGAAWLYFRFEQILHTAFESFS